MHVVLPIIVSNEVAVSTSQTYDLKPANDIKLIIICLFPCTVTFSRGNVILGWGGRMSKKCRKRGIGVGDNPKLNGKGVR